MIIMDGIDLYSNTTPICGTLKEVFIMADLKNEYIDTNNIKHEVKHIVMSDYDKNSKERIVDELFNVMMRPNRHIRA